MERLSDPRHAHRNRIILLLLTALILTFLIIPRQQLMTTSFKAGDIATSDVRATQDYLLEDRPLTQKKRAEAEMGTPNVYNLNEDMAQELLRSFEKALVIAREGKNIGGGGAVDAVHEVLGVNVSPRDVAALARVRPEKVLSEVGRLAGQVYTRNVVTEKRRFSLDSAHGILVLDGGTGEIAGAGDQPASAIDLSDARKMIGAARPAGGEDSADIQTIRELLARALQPNLTFDHEATEHRRRAAAAAVGPVLFQVKRGEMIVRVGDRITEAQALKLQKIFDSRHGVNSVFMGAGIFGLLLVLFYFPYRFARKNIRKFQPTNKDILLLSLATVFHFLMLKIGLVISTALGGVFPFAGTSDYYYLFPFAVSSMLVRIVLNSEVALVYCAITAPLLGFMFDSSLLVVVYALMGGVVGAHGVRQCKDRGTIYTAGLKVSVVNMALVLSFQLHNGALLTTETLFCIVFAFIGGFFNAVLVTGTIPLIENLLHYTTDIKLLELANLNSRILRELMVRAPGTYHHSVMVGNMVEAAAEAIHANPLLARVAAYYHDVGKVSKPLYFIENVSGGENRHDKLSPSMSALILISHVKEGVELAREHKLGLPIIDIIRQSHGTQLISYFYQKARNLAGPDTTIDERDFRYPGPKPQTREAGLVLLADCVEAASRTLADPTPARIQGLVQKIINNIFIDGQLDECELTLKNIHEIAKSFIRILTGVYHHRIEYPEPAYKEKGNGGRKTADDSPGQSPKTPLDRDEEAKKGSGEDLRRLGISR
nr:HDIG domain-containing metalloprotein [Geobacter sp. DSM 9736]